MLFDRITPEEAGISSYAVRDLLDYYNRRGLVMHSVLIAKGDELFCEAYWAPFHKDFCHRMYSETKSYVAIAIGLLEEDGLLSLDDPVSTYFEDKIERELPPYLAALTIRDLLMMRTVGSSSNWFTSEDPDRTHLYFASSASSRPANTLWEYDSAGSQVLASLVERLTKKSLFDFLNERIFCHLGTFKTAEILKTRNGDSWGDSALVCTPRDMISFGRFLLKEGVWDGKRLMNAEYIKEATASLSDNNRIGFMGATTHGYGYQIWRFEQGFGFNGMGCQFCICIPEQDMVFVCTGDNQGRPGAGDLIISGFFDYIARKCASAPLPPNAEAVDELERFSQDLTLATAHGAAFSPMMKEISGCTYTAKENPMGIKEFSFLFGENGEGEFHYTNSQGEKVLPFGLGKNVFTSFPQYGYSDGYGGIRTENGFVYRCASSVAFSEERVIQLRVQIIDRYFGNLFATFAFRGDEVAVRMVKNAEHFLEEYQGYLVARRCDK